jgi:hypothetical protein
VTILADRTISVPTLRRDQEDVRLITGFADCFAAVTLVGGMVALLGFAGAFIGAASGLLGIVAVWFLTVPLVEKRQFAACAIALTLAFALGLALPLFALLGSFGAPLVAGGLYFYWQRYRIPLSAALAIFAIVAFPALLIFSDNVLLRLDDLPNTASGAAIFVGFALFAIAMRWDLSDRDRKTRRSDVAFWLHLLAGPLTVHGLFSLLGVGRFDTDMINPWPVIALFACFTLIAIVIDRRPLLLASFGYFLLALGQIVYGQVAPTARGDYASVPQAAMIATLGGGLLVAVLAAGWTSVRRLALAAVPDAIVSRVPPASDWTPPADRQVNEARGETEPVRLVLGLNDYLATLALGVLFVGCIVAAYLIFSSTARVMVETRWQGDGKGDFNLWAGTTPWLALLIPFGMIVIAAEIFVRRQRMALTAVTASTQFAFVTMLAAMLFLWQQEGVARLSEAMITPGRDIAPFAMTNFIIASMAAALLNWGFGWLNRIPASAAWGALMLLPLLFVDQIMRLGINPGSQPDMPFAEVQLRLIVFGAATFIPAVLLDRSDPERRTQRADVAFWLHLLASLFLVIILFRWASELPAPGLAAVALFSLLTAAALVINRRAPILVGIPFVLAAIDAPDATTDLFIKLIFFALLMALVLYWEKVRGRALALTS